MLLTCPLVCWSIACRRSSHCRVLFCSGPDMKNYFTWIVVLGLLKPGLLDLGLLDLRAMAQQAPRAEIAGESGQAALLENGSLIYVELAKTLDARKAKAGDP